MSEEQDSPECRFQNHFKLLYTLLYHNLGGEMMYILNQRLIAQNVSVAKSSQVLSDILNGLIVNFKRASVYHCSSYDDLRLNRLKGVFQEILNASSSMRLTPASFDKLFDLMTGVLKYQIVLCPYPSSLYHVTHNHLESLREMSKHFDEALINRFKSLCNNFVKSCEGLSHQQWFVMRSILLTNIFATIRTRISVLLKEGLQEMEDGSYTIIPRHEKAASEVHYDENGQIIERFAGESDDVCDACNLGSDIYCRESPSDTRDMEGPFSRLKINETRETKLLVNLLGGRKDNLQEACSVFLDFSFGEEADDDSHKAEEAGSQMDDKITRDNHEVNFDATNRMQPARWDEDENELTKGNTESSEDLLALMDS